jgi:hypothetical protein
MNKSALIKKFHTVCSVNGVKDDQKKMIVGSYHVSSSKDLTEAQLNQLIRQITNDGQNQWRKRVMAAIGNFLRLVNKTENLDVIKAIACRASGYNDFNKIPVGRLRDIYYEFVRKNKTTQKSQYEKESIIHELEKCN